MYSCIIAATFLTRILTGGSSQYTRLYSWLALRALSSNTRASGPTPAYTIPILLEILDTLTKLLSSTSADGVFFSVAITIPVEAFLDNVQPLIPIAVIPDETAVSACSICTSFPEGEKVVSENA